MPETILYPIDNYQSKDKEPQLEEDSSDDARLRRLEDDFKEHGMRRTVEAVIITHKHNLPHVFMLDIAGTFFKLPGHYLEPGKDEKEGLREILEKQLGPSDPADGSSASDWTIGDCIGTWWRIDFDKYMYPYLPAHVTNPKEKRMMFIVHLPPHKMLHVPKNYKLRATPIHDLYGNAAQFGPQYPVIPCLLSPYNFKYEK